MCLRLGIGWSRERKELSIKLTQKTKKYLSVIQEAKESGNLAIFVGAGFSVSENNKKYKSWSGVTKKLIKELNCNKNLDNLKIAELYKLQFGKAKLKQAVLQSFPKTPDVAGTLHKELVNLNPHYIITTNWDKLIDDAIEKTTNIYDIIVNDNELVKSVNNSKYIKMHGDFEHDNFVYAESDYLNYSANFPLIENFLKSIFSTHVIVLLGYSFNDMDLKQIVSWVKDNSKERLPIYMITTSPKDTAELNYLGKYGIKAFQICNTNNLSKPSFIEFFKLCDKYNPLNYIKNPCAYFYEKLKSLEDYSVILQSQIDDSLSNCCIEYHGDNKAYLCLHNEAATYDYDEKVREIYELFLKNIFKYNEHGNKNNKVFRKIINILKRADIHGVCNDGINKHPLSITFDADADYDIYDNYSSAFSFDFNKDNLSSNENQLLKIFFLYSTEQYTKAFLKNEKLIYQYKNENNYKYLFLCFFNFNILLKLINFSFISDEKSKKAFEQYKLINIENEFSKLPEKIQKTVAPINNVVNFEKIHKLYHSVQNDIEKVKEHKRILVEGGKSWKTYNGHHLIHKNLVDFIVNNGICFEDFEEYKTTCKKFIELSQINQIDEKKWQPNKTELYSCIRYYDFKELKILLENYKQHRLIISEELQLWLIESVLNNCTRNYINKKTPFSHLEKYIDNTLLILSFLELSLSNSKIIVNQINRVIKNARNNMSIFESIDLFFITQFELFREKSYLIGKPALSVFETLLKKLVADKCNMYEIESLLNYKLISIYNMVIQDSTRFSNQVLLQKLLKNTEEMDSQKDKYRFIEKLIMIIYQMSNEKCKTIIREFIQSLDIVQDKNSEDYYTFMLTLKNLNFENNEEELKNDLSNYLESIPNSPFSSKIYGIQSSLESVSKKDSSYNDLLQRANSIIENHNKNNPLSIFKHDSI